MTSDGRDPRERADRDPREPQDRESREREGRDAVPETDAGQAAASDRDLPPENGDETVSDAELIQYLDGELSGPARASLETRVAGSPAAARRLETLRRRSAGLSALLLDVDPGEAEVRRRAEAIRPRMGGDAHGTGDVLGLPADSASPGDPGDASRDDHGIPFPAPGRTGTRVIRVQMPRSAWLRLPAPLRAAAVIALLLAAAFAVPPARAWMIERTRDVAEALGLASAPGPAETVPTPAGADVAVTFPVPGDAFEIHLPRPAGLLVIRRGDGETGTAEARGTAGTPASPDISFVVLPAGLRIEGAAPEAVYEVALPPTVGSVRVRPGDGAAAVHPLPAEGETLRIDFRTGG